MAHTASPENSRLKDKETDGRIEGRRLRGLSWNKTHQLWRVRIYYNGKLRFVGRFEDAITAARAYDKAAVYLYGASAITNFGLEACLADPTEVGSCIVRAKEEAEQQNAARQAAGINSPLQRGKQQQQQQQQQAHSPPQQGTPNSANPPHLYTSTGSSGSLSSRWSMPL
ncbi:hypothetical protein OEZ86_009440 [Tetradesmus obliquus]|nr:hypothetical protein OEZ86_009440 [Tetradesmus obliquus]